MLNLLLSFIQFGFEKKQNVERFVKTLANLFSYSS